MRLMPTEAELLNWVTSQRYEVAFEWALGKIGSLSPWARYLVGQCYFRLSKVEDAIDIWNGLEKTEEDLFFVRNRVAQISRFPEAVFGCSISSELQPRVHVLILTSGRRKLLAGVLDCLKKTDYDNYRLFILDNGSLDDTWTFIESLGERFGIAQPEVLRLPTNVGRPAGHNFMLSHWDHSSSEFISILDDDLIAFESNWLNQLVHTIQVHDDIGAVGTKTIGPEGLIQDAFPAFVGLGDGTEVHFHTRRGEIDVGQFDVINDYADYVTGCSSLFRKDIFKDVGEFDIRFSPSQFVDIDHGIRMRLSGWNLVFNGNCSVAHAQCTHEERKVSRSVAGNQRGNAYKLSQKHEPEVFSKVVSDRLLRQQQMAFYSER